MLLGKDTSELTRLSASRVAELLGFVFAVVLAIWLTWGIWSVGPPVGDDTVAHIIRAEYAIPRFVLNGRLDGWQPSFALGYQQHLFIGPMFTWTVALVQGLSLGTLSILEAFKVTVVFLFAALPLAAGYLARSFGLSRTASSVAAVLSLLVNSPFGGFGLSGLFGVGLTVNLPGAVALCFTVGAFLRLMGEPSVSRAVLAGVFFAVLTATHGISLILAVVLVLVLFVLINLETALNSSPLMIRFRQIVSLGGKYCDNSDLSAAPLGSMSFFQLSTRVGLSVIVGFFISAWIVIPILAHYDLRGIITGWGHTPLLRRMADIWAGHILFQHAVSVSVFFGLIYGLWRFVCGRQFALSLVLAPFAFLGIGELFNFFAPENVVSQQIPNRGLGVAGLIAVFPLAALVTTLSQLSGKLKAFVAIVVAVAFVFVTLDKLRPMIRSVTPTPVALEAAAQIKKLVPQGARFAMQRDFPDEIRVVGMSHPDFWMAWQSGKSTLNVFNVESSSTPTPAYTPDSMTNQPPEQVADKLSRYGVTHVLLINQTRALTLVESERFNLVWQRSPMAILAVVPKQGQPNPASLVATECPSQAKLVSPDPERLRFVVETEAPCNATLAVGWSPKWLARIDGERVKVGKTEEGLLMVMLKTGSQEVALDFSEDIWDHLGRLLSTLAIITVAIYGWKRSQVKV